MTIRNILLLFLIVCSNNIIYAQSEAPQFTLLDWKNNQISLSQFKGKVICLNFWGTGCSGEKYFNWSKQLSHKLKNYDDIVFINVATRSDYNKWLQIVSNGVPAGINLCDKDNRVEALYRVSEYPYTFVIGKSGKILGRDPEGDILDYALIRAREEVASKAAFFEIIRNMKSPEKNENVFKYFNERYKSEQDLTYSYSVF